MKPLNPIRWAEVQPGVVLVPNQRCGSSALCHAIRLKQGIPLDSQNPHLGFVIFEHVNYGLHLRELPLETEFVIVGRHPIRRFESARHRLLAERPEVPSSTWEHFIEWASHTIDPHVLPISRFVAHYFAVRKHRVVRIEDYTTWGPALGLPRILPTSNVSSTYERLPKQLIRQVTSLYESDFKLFNYPIP